MKKIYLSAVAVAVLFIGGVYAYNALSGDSEEPTTQDTQTTSEVAETTEVNEADVNEAESVDNVEDTDKSVGQYLEYNKKNLADTKDSKQIVFFHAPWCPTCRAFEQKINEEGVPKGVTILKLDYDSNPDLRQEYGVPYQSYLVYIDDKGELLDIWYTEETNTLNDVAKRVGA